VKEYFGTKKRSHLRGSYLTPTQWENKIVFHFLFLVWIYEGGSHLVGMNNDNVFNDESCEAMIWYQYQLHFQGVRLQNTINNPFIDSY